jgi:GNAT superfamily N-acetyltransferase
MDLRLQEVVGRRQLKAYIFLPRILYARHPKWVPPLYADEWNFHDPRHNSALAYSAVIRLLAFHDQTPVGRIMGIINRKYNEQHREKTARFFNLDCIDDGVVVAVLLRAVETWSRQQGADTVIGPYGFSDKDPQGLQIEGFDHLPVIATPSNPPFLQKWVEAQGYGKRVECISYRFEVPKSLPPLFEKIYDRLHRQADFQLIEFKNKRKLKPFIAPVFRLVNETYAPLFGFVPMSEAEIQKFAAQYLPVLDPEFVKVVTSVDDEIVAFIVAMPDMSPGLQRARGKLFPFGFIHILRAMKKTKQLNLLLGAVSPKHRGKGITVMLGKALFETAIQRGLELVDSHLVLETNLSMRAECEHLGGTIYKRYRIYQKRLS